MQNNIFSYKTVQIGAFFFTILQGFKLFYLQTIFVRILSFFKLAFFTKNMLLLTNYLCYYSTFFLKKLVSSFSFYHLFKLISYFPNNICYPFFYKIVLYVLIKSFFFSFLIPQSHTFFYYTESM